MSVPFEKQMKRISKLIIRKGVVERSSCAFCPSLCTREEGRLWKMMEDGFSSEQRGSRSGGGTTHVIILEPPGGFPQYVTARGRGGGA